MELELSSSVAINLVGTVNQGQGSGGGSLIQTFAYKTTVGTSTQQDALANSNIIMGSADYLGLIAEYAIETSAGGRRFGTVEVVFDNAQAQFVDSSTVDVGGNTQDVFFQANGDPLQLIIVNGSSTDTVDIAMSFKLIAVP
jgi:hypothetical protein